VGRSALLIVLAAAACDAGTRSLGVGPAADLAEVAAGRAGASGRPGEEAGAGSPSSTGGQGGTPAAGGDGGASGSGAMTASGGAAPQAGSGGAAGEETNPGVAGEAGAGPVPGSVKVTRVSVTSDGAAADSGSATPRVSSDGRFVVFYSMAANLAPDDNLTWDVFLHDRETGRTVLASADTSGRSGDATSWSGALSGDGRTVCFISWSTTFAPNRGNQWPTLYVGGPLGPSDPFLSNLTPLTPAEADQTSGGCSISADGARIAFESQASNLIPGETNAPGSYVFDSETGLERVRYTLDGLTETTPSPGQAPLLSADGSLLAVEIIDATGVETVFAHELATGVSTPVALPHDGTNLDGPNFLPSLSADGRRIAFVSLATNLLPADSNGVADAYLRDFSGDSLERISLSTEGAEADGATLEAAVSGDGRRVAFVSTATNLVAGTPHAGAAIYLRDLETRVTTRLPFPPPGRDEYFEGLSFSHDGKILVFASNVPRIVEGDDGPTADVFAVEFGEDFRASSAGN
jgi:Tol biopolymer transport system component